MSDGEKPTDGHRQEPAETPSSISPESSWVERLAGRVTLRYRPGAYDSEELDRLAVRAERIARYVDKRLKPLAGPGRNFEPLTLELEPADTPSTSPWQARADPDQWLALAIVRRRLGGPDLWIPPVGQVDAAAIANALEFLALGLARHLASGAERSERGYLFPDAAGGGVLRQSADQVCRQVAADRDGRVPLYESMVGGHGPAGSPPEYAALAESFCGYIFEREGPKAYLRFVKGCRENPNAAADVVYSKTLEELQQEWLGAILRGQGRRPVSLKAFALQIGPYLRPYTWFVILAIILMFMSAGVSQVAPFVLRDITDILAPLANKGDLEFVSDYLQVLTGGLDNASFVEEHSQALGTLNTLYIKLAILALAGFVNLAAVGWLVYLVNVVGQNILRDLRVRLTDRLHHLSAGFYARRRMGDMLVRFTSDIPRMADPLVEVTAYSVYHAVRLVFTIYSMLVMSWQLSLLLFVIVPIYVGAVRKFARAIQVASRARQERLSQLNANLEEMLFGHSLVKAYGLGGHLMKRFRPKISEYRKVAIWTDFLRAGYREVIGTVDNLQSKLVFGFGGSLVVFGGTTLGTVIAFNTLMGRFLIPLHGLMGAYTLVAVAAASLRRVEEVLREPMEEMDTPPDGSYAPDEVREAINFENVGFSYTGVEPTLIDVNLSIPARSSVAFVGPTGAGKSTLVNLIPRFYDVDHGAVKIDGQDIRSFSLAGLRQTISIVSQDTFLFNSTIRENIRLGRLDASDDEVVEAARGARLHDFIESLPAGYDTLVGERGWRLSGGQKQRVAIARALLRNSPILILDEATSSLDAETESEILSELDDVTRGKTVISITHRLGLAIKSEKIFVLQAGQIVQQGSHEELMRQAGLYRKLFEDQNRELLERGAIDRLEVTLNTGRSLPAFNMVRTPQLADLSGPLEVEHHLAGEVFCQQNGADGKFYLLRSGQVELTLHGDHGPEQSLQIGAPDGHDGATKMSLLLTIPQSVSARAVTDTELQVLREDDMRNLLGDSGPGQRLTAAQETSS